MRRAAVLLIAAAACSGNAQQAPAPGPAPVVHTDAGVDGITRIAPRDPGMHLDDDDPGPLVTRPPPTGGGRPGRPIDITLRSSPPGARVAVDGAPLGVTPAYWSGETGAEHEFTFVRAGYAMARYRFVPVTSGVIHAQLDPIAEEPINAPTPELAVPPGIPRDPQPPPTVVSPNLDAVIPDASSGSTHGPQP